MYPLPRAPLSNFHLYNQGLFEIQPTYCDTSWRLWLLQPRLGPNTYFLASSLLLKKHFQHRHQYTWQSDQVNLKGQAFTDTCESYSGAEWATKGRVRERGGKVGKRSSDFQSVTSAGRARANPLPTSWVSYVTPPPDHRWEEVLPGEGVIWLADRQIGLHRKEQGVPSKT